MLLSTQNIICQAYFFETIGTYQYFGLGAHGSVSILFDGYSCGSFVVLWTLTLLGYRGAAALDRKLLAMLATSGENMGIDWRRYKEATPLQ